MVAGAWGRYGNRVKKLSGFLAIVLVVVVLLQGCSSASASRLKVVTGTSLLAYVTQEVGGDRVEVVNLIPPTQHPGNFDIKPGDIQKMNGAALFLVHGWPGEGYVDQLVGAADNPDIKVVKIQIAGNWMTPAVQSQAADKVAAALAGIDPTNTAAYNKAAADYKVRVGTEESAAKAKLADLAKSVNVLASDKQAGFLQWLGFNIVATYSDVTALTPDTLKTLVDKGKQAGIALVVDNYQSGAEAGKGLAEELGAGKVALSNFPGAFDDTDTWEKAVDRNISIILDALGK